MPPIKKRNKPQADLTACKVIVRNLFSKRYKNFAWVFYDPIDSEMLALYDYHLVVKQPMDLSTVKFRLNSNYYATAADFARDMRLIFRNTYLYTTPEHLCYDMAKELEVVFEDMFAKVPVANSGNESGICSDASSDITAEVGHGSITSQPPSNFGHTIHNGIVRNLETRLPMTTQDDLLLHNRVQDLDGVMLLNVIHMIHQMEDLHFGYGAKELEFDVRILKPNTKRAILSYLESKDMTDKRQSRGKKNY